MASTLTFASERVDSIIGYEFTTWYESGTMNSNEWRVQDSVFVYDENGNLTDTIDMVPGGVVLNIEAGQWHSLKCLESGTVLLEAKDGKYEPLAEDEILA